MCSSALKHRALLFDSISSPAQAEQQAEALRKAKEAPAGEANDFDKAAEFGRLRTVKVQQAAAQDAVEREMAREMAVRMRQAQRNMKGVKLQYTEAGRITFDDVAGIGDAKARPVSRVFQKLEGPASVVIVPAPQHELAVR